MPPNIIFIITDNQSDWTLGCYGNREIKTPNIDRLASGGIRLDRAYCVNPVCSPNRATYLTGLIPSQHGVHNWLGGERPDAQMGPDAYCTIREFDTIPETLAGSGYHCGMVGKWHLGDSLHPQLGFDYWFAKPKGHTSSFYDAEAIWQGEVYIEHRYYTDAIADHAVDFLNTHAEGTRRDDPFFLYVGFNGPYGLDNDLRTGHRNRWTDYYADQPLESFPRTETHPWLEKYRDLMRSETAIKGYAAAVSGVDDAVGVILDRLEAMGLSEDTLVIYTADHGLCAGHHGFWGMGDHSRPMHMVEENLHIPMILRHPARIPPGQWDGRVCTYDLYPTLKEYLGLSDTAEPDAAGGEATVRCAPGLRPAGVARLPRPGRSYASALTSGDSNWDDTTFHEYEDTRAIHTDRYKLIRRHPSGPDELYDLESDPGETRNLIDDPGNTAVRDELDERLAAFFDQYAVPIYDLWRGGATKAGRAIPELAPESEG